MFVQVLESRQASSRLIFDGKLELERNKQRANKESLSLEGLCSRVFKKIGPNCLKPSKLERSA